ncbi:MAG: AbrB/MazE/SpoVT family DNA-binding domain-containing protein [Nanoarchaeota archaeon]
MTIIKTKIKRWGNSLGIIIPSEVILSNNVKENDSVEFIMLKNSKKAFEETFGLLKEKLKKPSQKMKDELREELYND